MNKTFNIILLIFISIVIIRAQSGFEDADGKSSIIIGTGGTGKINITDANIKILYLFHRSDLHFRFGVEITGKAENGFASLFQNENIAPNATGKLSFGYQWILSKKPEGKPLKSIIVDDWATIQFGYKKAEYKLFNPINPLNTQIQKQIFDGFNVTGYYNILFRSNFMFGFSIGYDGQNNYMSLKEVTVTDRTLVVNDTNFQRYTDNTQKIRQGSLIKSNHLLINYDLIWIPDFMNDLIGVDIFGRYDKDSNGNNYTPGFGFFITQNGAPTQVIGGISFSYKQKELNIGLIAGYNF